MPEQASVVSIIVGGCLVLGPMVYAYLLQRQVVQVMTMKGFTQFSFGNALPDYYAPWCLFLGAVLMGFGVILAFREKRARSGGLQGHEEPEAEN